METPKRTPGRIKGLAAMFEQGGSGSSPSPAPSPNPLRSEFKPIGRVKTDFVAIEGANGTLGLKKADSPAPSPMASKFGPSVLRAAPVETPKEVNGKEEVKDEVPVEKVALPGLVPEKATTPSAVEKTEEKLVVPELAPKEVEVTKEPEPAPEPEIVQEKETVPDVEAIVPEPPVSKGKAKEEVPQVEEAAAAEEPMEASVEPPKAAAKKKAKKGKKAKAKKEEKAAEVEPEVVAEAVPVEVAKEEPEVVAEAAPVEVAKEEPEVVAEAAPVEVAKEEPEIVAEPVKEVEAVPEQPKEPEAAPPTPTVKTPVEHIEPEPRVEEEPPAEETPLVTDVVPEEAKEEVIQASEEAPVEAPTPKAAHVDEGKEVALPEELTQVAEPVAEVHEAEVEPTPGPEPAADATVEEAPAHVEEDAEPEAEAAPVEEAGADEAELPQETDAPESELAGVEDDVKPSTSKTARPKSTLYGKSGVPRTKPTGPKPTPAPVAKAAPKTTIPRATPASKAPTPRPTVSTAPAKLRAPASAISAARSPTTTATSPITADSPTSAFKLDRKSTMPPPPVKAPTHRPTHSRTTSSVKAKVDAGFIKPPPKPATVPLEPRNTSAYAPTSASASKTLGTKENIPIPAKPISRQKSPSRINELSQPRYKRPSSRVSSPSRAGQERNMSSRLSMASDVSSATQKPSRPLSQTIDSGFLARLSRPTASSASKQVDKNAVAHVVAHAKKPSTLHKKKTEDGQEHGSQDETTTDEGDRSLSQTGGDDVGEEVLGGDETLPSEVSQGDEGEVHETHEGEIAV